MQELPWRFKQQVRWLEEKGASGDAVSVMMSEMQRSRDKHCQESEVNDVSKNVSTDSAIHGSSVAVLSKSL